jgi:hypothetical protein
MAKGKRKGKGKGNGNKKSAGKSTSKGVSKSKSKDQGKGKGGVSAREKTTLASWRTSCDECGEELTADDALYHWGGLGPLCEACIKADPELEGLKWEAKAEFWRD